MFKEKQMLSRLLTVFLILISFTINTFAFARTQSLFPMTGQPVASMQLFEKEFTSFMRFWSIPGGSVTIIDSKGRLVYSRGFGWADMQARQPVQPSSLFRIASISKTFTSVSILKLAQNGQLNLNDRVFPLLNLSPLPGYKANPKINTITILDLLHMSSGWFSSGIGHVDPIFGPWPKKMVAMMNSQLPATCYMTTRMMMSFPLRHKPGSSYAYSNLDYCMLGLIIDRVAGAPYDYLGYQNYVLNNLLMPLGISDMRIGGTLLTDRIANEVHYYRNAGEISAQELANSYYFPYSNEQILRKGFANGGWIASSIDLAKFFYALHHGQILNKKYINIMTARPAFVGKKRKNYYTMGMQMYNSHGQIYWLQTGSFTGTNAMVVIKPNGTTIAAVFNTRPSIYTFFTRFRPELKGLLLSKHIGF